MSLQRTPPKPKVNEKGQFISLLAASPDGKDLKNYVEQQAIPMEMTPNAVVKKFPQFQSYEYTTFSGALRRARMVYRKQVEDRAKKNGCELYFQLNTYSDLYI